MFKSFRVGSLFGIPIKLDVTFLLILPIFAWLIGLQIAELTEVLNAFLATDIAVDPLLPGWWPWILGFVAAVGLFVGVVLHELGHSLVAIRHGTSIDSITLWLFGGLAQLADQPEEWQTELRIAVAGPIVSVAVGVVCYLGMLALPVEYDAARFVLAYLAVLNVVLAGFNMLPGFPMDGGRVLRALLARNRPFAQATQIAAEVGKTFALLLGLFGLFQLNWILIGIAFFIYIGAAGEAQQAVMKAAFEGVAVRDVMTPGPEVDTVTPKTTIAELLERMFGERHTGYPVLSNGALVGLVTLEDAREIDQVEREAFTVADVMSTDLHTVEPDADAMDAFETMQREGIGRLLVTDPGGGRVDSSGGRVDSGGELDGLLSRTDLMTAFNIVKSSGSNEIARRVAEDEPVVGDGEGRGVRSSETDGDKRGDRDGSILDEERGRR